MSSIGNISVITASELADLERLCGDHRDEFQIDPAWTFLNHGSFGACPRAVREEQDRWRDRMERQPVRFLARELFDHLNEAREVLAPPLGARPQNLCFVPNASTGVNAVVDSYPLQSCDIILTTSHRYFAVRRTLDRKAQRSGAHVEEVPIPDQLNDPQEIVDGFKRAINAKTRLIVIDQISSPTALQFPVGAICKLARERGIHVLIDGAHAPGHVPLDLETLDADWWTGNLHKWVCAPKGSALLWVNPRNQAQIHHPVASHGFDLGLHAEFDWPGTYDPSAFLSGPTAWRLHEAWGGPQRMQLNHRLVRYGRQLLLDIPGLSSQHPDEERWYGAMATVALPLPPSKAGAVAAALQGSQVECPVMAWGNQLYLRISAFSAYNRPADYRHLASVLPQVLAQVRSQD